MNIDFEKVFPIINHHAYAIEGDWLVAEALSLYIGNIENISIKGNPDFLIFNLDSLGIDEGRAIFDFHSRKPLSHKQYFIICAGTISREAQNALLKMFEEPRGDSVFFLILNRLSNLLPTLRSRMMVIQLPSLQGQSGHFLKLSLTERLALIKKIIASKDQEKVRSVIDECERYISRNISADKSVVKLAEEVLMCRTYLEDRGSSPKIILEHLALIMP